MREFVGEVKAIGVQAPIVAGSTVSKQSDHVDLAGFDSVCFVGFQGTAGSTCVTTLKVQTSTSTTAWTDLSGATVSSSKGEDDKLLIVDVVRPKQRYVRSYITKSSTVGGCEYGGTVAYLYGSRHLNVTQGTSTHAATPVSVYTT